MARMHRAKEEPPRFRWEEGGSAVSAKAISLVSDPHPIIETEITLID